MRYVLLALTIIALMTGLARAGSNSEEYGFVPEHMPVVELSPTFFDGDVTITCTRHEADPSKDGCNMTVKGSSGYFVVLLDWDSPKGAAIARSSLCRTFYGTNIRPSNGKGLPQWLLIQVWSRTKTEERGINLRTY
ncbi:hypothetical protein FJY94_06465 [Candidatus Kaiserbacteria bacterium]|nr:hypothetical protein [Candidatus Kaiserbacteria bacterium]